MQKLRVGVLMGGKSIEREVSFNSGRTICDHLDTTRYEVIPLFQSHNGSLYLIPWKFLCRGKIVDFEARLTKEAELISWDTLKKLIDFIYIAMHGSFAEDGTLQGLLELLQIPYLGPKVFGSALSMDKIIQKKILNRHGIAFPHFCVIKAHDIENLTLAITMHAIEKIQSSFPYIIKPCNEGSSLGISIAFNENELLNAIKKAAYIDPQCTQDVLIEQTIKGMEFSCVIFKNHATQEYLLLPPTEIVPEKGTHFFDYEQKYMPGRSLKFTPARCSKQAQELIQQTCLKTMQALHISMARIDGFLTNDNEVIIIDPNTLSGMGPSSFLFRQAAELNLNHTQIINYLIESELHYYSINFTQTHETRMALSMQPKKKIGVLFGGRSNECEISLESGRNILYKLSPEKYEGMALYVSKDLQIFQVTQEILVRNSTHEIENDLSQALPIAWNDLPTLIDFAFIGLHGGEGENGCIQGTLEMLGIPYNGSSVLTSALCMNKYETNELLKAEGFEVPQSYFLSAKEWIQDQENALKKVTKRLTFPCIAKPHDDGCSVLVAKIHSLQELKDFCTHVFTTTSKTHVLIEEFIQGMELTVGVLGNNTLHVLPPSQSIAQGTILSIEEKFLPGAGENQTPADLPYETLEYVKNIIGKVYKSVNVQGYARIDCFYQNEHQNPAGYARVVILEINTLPALTPATCIFHQAAEIGIKPMDFIDTLITLGFELHNASNYLDKKTIHQSTI